MTPIKFLTLLFRGFKGAIHGAKNSPRHRQQPTAFVRSSLNSEYHWPSLEEFEFEVIGESNYQKHLQSIVGDHGKRSAELNTKALLVPEPDNPYDKNAVYVHIAGAKVGYLLKEDAPRYLRRVTRRKLAKTAITSCDAVVVGGFIRDDGSKANYGVKLDLKPFDE